MKFSDSPLYLVLLVLSVVLSWTAIILRFWGAA